MEKGKKEQELQEYIEGRGVGARALRGHGEMEGGTGTEREIGEREGGGARNGGRCMNCKGTWRKRMK